MLLAMLALSLRMWLMSMWYKTAIWVQAHARSWRYCSYSHTIWLVEHT